MSTAVPYPRTVRSKGWRFQLDHERIRQSDTWALAPTDLRPWLLMLWMVAWEQVPCGSLPSDDALIAARMGMADKAFTKAKPLLLRGWWKADDGRLYHPVITEQVLALEQRRAEEAERKAEYRKKRCGTDAGLPRDSGGNAEMSHGTDAGLPRDSRGNAEMSHGTDAGLPRDSHGIPPSATPPEPEPEPEPSLKDKRKSREGLSFESSERAQAPTHPPTPTLSKTASPTQQPPFASGPIPDDWQPDGDAGTAKAAFAKLRMAGFSESRALSLIANRAMTEKWRGYHAGRWFSPSQILGSWVRWAIDERAHLAKAQPSQSDDPKPIPLDQLYA